MSWSGVGAQVGTMLGESHPVATIPPLAMDAEAVGCVAKRVCLKQGKIGSGTFATVFAYVSDLLEPQAPVPVMPASEQSAWCGAPPLRPHGRGPYSLAGCDCVSVS